MAEVMPYTCQDIARLANIWTVVKGLGQGTYLEVGSYQGGTALHICNAMPQVGSKFYCVDPFETGSFEHVHSWEKKPAEFTDTRQDAVVALLSHKHFAQVVPGFFPSAIEPMNLKDIVFCHLDVNMYEATRKSLDFLVQRIAPHGCIIVDDYGHSLTPGVNRAVEEFLAEEPHFRSIPLFPCQVLLLAKGLR
ncbi:MAG TPA: class I SAM-dependent methyltransferase [Terracidiphilus sp.]|nr:class I SAM-dependent methyltransferase [Terracidiphilus sp.]